MKINMVDYVESMVKDFPGKVSKSNYPWNKNLFKEDDMSNLLSKNQKEIVHTIVTKGLFLCKKGWPDTQPAITFLSTRVRELTEEDWNILD
jgi:hypothetical protein